MILIATVQANPEGDHTKELMSIGHDWAAQCRCSGDTEWQQLRRYGKEEQSGCIDPAPSLAAVLKMGRGARWACSVRMTLVFLLHFLAHSLSSFAGFPCS